MTPEPPFAPAPLLASAPPLRARRRLPLALTLAALTVGLACGVSGAQARGVDARAQDAAPRSRDAASERRPQAPRELFEVLKIVDGDTLHIARAGKTEKLRLLSVDTEEKLTPGMQSSPTKPQTVFGEETRLWTVDFLEQFRQADGEIRVGLAFPEDEEAYDVYGRLLCHVLLPDGTDFNLLLVELGKSPYFNKYGNSRISHAAFALAQARARRNLIGVWDPRTNRSKDGTSPSAVRPYDRLLPWWQARADAIDDFRERARRDPGRVLAADDPLALEAALAAGETVQLFGTPERFFEEDDGSRTVLFRSGDKRRALRVSIPAASREDFSALDLDGLLDEYRQNYVYVQGTLSRGPRGFRMVTARPAAWRRAGAEPRATDRR